MNNFLVFSTFGAKANEVPCFDSLIIFSENLRYDMTQKIEACR